jgi:hypothetical protein
LFPLNLCLLQFLIPQALYSSLLASPQARRAPLPLLPDIPLTFFFFMINPPVISISFLRLIINLIYFSTPTITRMHPSNSFMDRSAIGNVLPVFGILVAAFGAVILRGKLQTFIPTVSEEGTSPVCTLLLLHIFCLFLPAHLFFISPLLLFVFTLLVALLFLLTLPLV